MLAVLDTVEAVRLSDQLDYNSPDSCTA
jgi:hypothetical protein